MRLYVLCAVPFAVAVAACAFEPNGPGGPDDDPGLPDPGIPSDVDAAPVEQPPDDPTPLPPDPPLPEAPTVWCRVEGTNLGVVGVKVMASNRTYTFESWQTGAGGAVVGFTLTGPADVRYEVRTSTDRHNGTALIYSGEERIMRVDFCVSFDD
ncbi:MAG TPA: hypothetical protein VM261_31505 [Kofleriaceae bacterium]|nr:hypothetical protein [Kofleriaceae bacterium]